METIIELLSRIFILGPDLLFTETINAPTNDPAPKADINKPYIFSP